MDEFDKMIESINRLRVREARVKEMEFKLGMATARVSELESRLKMAMAAYEMSKGRADGVS